MQWQSCFVGTFFISNKHKRFADNIIVHGDSIVFPE